MDLIELWIVPFMQSTNIKGHVTLWSIVKQTKDLRNMIGGEQKLTAQPLY